jgi:hypothetical protein
MDAVQRLTTLEQLRDFVRSVLCGRDQLDPQQTPLVETVLRKRGRPCGLIFELHGPRRVRTSAVWAADESRVLFYDSLGVRFTQVQLSEGPGLRELA